MAFYIWSGLGGSGTLAFVFNRLSFFRNNFNNDGSFLENFKKLTQAASFIEQTNSMDNATGDLGSETSSIKETGKVLVSDKNCVQACDKPAGIIMWWLCWT